VADEAVALTHRHRPDVVLLDIQMPGLDGLTAVARLHRELTAVGVIMLTTFGQDEYVTRALEEGADGFLLKADDPRELLNGVATFALMEGWFQEGARQREPMDLAAEREQAADYSYMYRPLPGVADEPVAGLRTGSFLMTPNEAHDDVVILYIHGGGFRSGLAAGARGPGAHLARTTRARVVLPEYRLAPEHPFPAGRTGPSHARGLRGWSTGGRPSGQPSRRRPPTPATAVPPGVRC
jgi:CheY-like chemotaxis protein